MNDRSRVIEILLVEDNPGDVRLTKEALKEGKIKNNLNVVNDGVEALKYLRKQPPYQDSGTPDLVLLDLNLPRLDGRQVLESIKSDATLRSLPVVVLTTSEAEEDVLRSYDLHVNCFIKKPVDLGQFVDVIRAIDHFWFSVVTLPPSGA